MVCPGVFERFFIADARFRLQWFFPPRPTAWLFPTDNYPGLIQRPGLTDRCPAWWRAYREWCRVPVVFTREQAFGWAHQTAHWFVNCPVQLVFASNAFRQNLSGYVRLSIMAYYYASAICSCALINTKRTARSRMSGDQQGCLLIGSSSFCSQQV